MEPAAGQEGFMRNRRGIRSERLDHLGIVAGVCQEIGLAAYLDARAGPNEQQVSVGTATVAMILERTRLQHSPAVSGLAVLCDQPRGAPAGAGDHRGAAARRLSGTGAGLVVRP